MSFCILFIYIISLKNGLFLQDIRRTFLSKLGQKGMKGEISKIGFLKGVLIKLMTQILNRRSAPSTKRTILWTGRKQFRWG